LSKIKNNSYDQYGAEPFEQQQFGTTGLEGLNCPEVVCKCSVFISQHILTSVKADLANSFISAVEGV